MSFLKVRGYSMVFMNDDFGEKLKEERIKRKYPFEEMNKTVPVNPVNMYFGDQTNLKLKSLKSKEPNSDNLFFRLAIINYEFGDLNRSIVYSERFCNDETIFKVGDNKKVMFRDGFKDKNIILSEGKLALSDMLTQLYLLSLSLGWDWEELRKDGCQHLEERHKDFKRDGWTEVKK